MKYPIKSNKLIIACGLLYTCNFSYAQKQKPNIILINIDDLGWSDVGYIDSTYYETSHINCLYNKGISFQSAYAGGANSAPSRACLLSGLNTPRHGIYTVDPAERGRAEDRLLSPYPNKNVLDSTFQTLPALLKTAGYQTCHIGKWHIGTDPLKQGMDVNIAGNHAGHPYSYFSPYHNKNLEDGPAGEYLMDRLAKEAVNYLDTVSRNHPFFLYYATYAVHGPLQAKPEMINKYKLKAGTEAHRNPVYAAMIENMDTSVGHILDAVERNRLSENTLIIFTSDNGGVYDVSRQWPLRAGKGSFYEGGIRVPFIIYMKGRYEGGIKTDVPISQLDLYPTLAEIAGARINITPDGENLLHFLNRGQTGYLMNRTLYWNFPGYLEGGNKESRDVLFRTRPVSVLLQNKWKLIRNHEDGRLELYNLQTDLSEKTDLSEQYPDIARKLDKQLKNWLKQTHAPVPVQKK